MILGCGQTRSYPAPPRPIGQSQAETPSSDDDGNEYDYEEEN